MNIESFCSSNSRWVTAFSIAILACSAAASRIEPPSQTHSFPSITPLTKASGAEGSATISAAVARMKSSPTTLQLSYLTKEPIPRDETPSFTPSSKREDAIFPIGVSRILAFPT